MTRPLRVVHVAMEMTPAIKVGGLADVVAGLGAEQQRQGADVRVILPDYGGLFHEVAQTPLPHAAWDLAWNGTPRRQSMSLGRVAGFEGQVYLLDDPSFRGRPAVYVDPETGSEFQDTAERCLAFCRGALALLGRIDWVPDIVHVHDFQTAPVPVMLRRGPQLGLDPLPKTVLTIHNLAFQGVYDPDTWSLVQVPLEGWYPGGPLEFWGKTNFLKAGLLDADRITTVSCRYAEEITRDPDMGEGLGGVLAGLGDRLTGIVNGLDTEVWNPNSDPLLPHPYSRTTLAGKRKNKGALLERVGFSRRLDRPVLGMVTRLTSQKGLDLLVEGWNEFMQRDVSLVVLGSGERRFEEFFQAQAAGQPGRVFYQNAFDEPLAHLIQGGADILLMPSRYEPCGLTQLIAMRYGTVPLVRRVGGLAETVDDADQAGDLGTGFSFDGYTPAALLDTVDRAVGAYEDRRRWEKIMKRGMEQDVSWKRPAGRYLELYRQLAGPVASRRWSGPRTGRSARAGASQEGDL